MGLVLTEDQELLSKTAEDFVRANAPTNHVRALRDAEDVVGFSQDLWKEMAKLGWTGILVPEGFGGAGLGLTDLAVVLEALGKNLTPQPFLSTVLLAGQLVCTAGTAKQQENILPSIATGDTIAAVAYQEAYSRYFLNRVTTSAAKQADVWTLSGEKIQVLDGQTADTFVVSARTAGEKDDTDGITLFLVRSDAPGLEGESQSRLDGRAAAIVRLQNVSVPDKDVLGPVQGGLTALNHSVDVATVGLCAEMLGGMNQIFQETLTYLKAREQFGSVIGSFQALKHRAAKVFMEIELCRSTVMAAAAAVDNGADDIPLLTSLAKARCSDAFVLATNEAVQMHGGIGMTDEHDAGFYMKRARAAEMTFGDGAWHRDRWAKLRGY